MARTLSKSAGDSQYCVMRAPFGCLGIETQMVDGSLMISRIDYLRSSTPLIKPQNQLAKEAVNQISTYFLNPHYQFDLPLKPTGTIHQSKVWKSVLDIAAGQTTTYGEIAQKIKSGARAVGTACGANPYPLLTPCHRVVSAQGIGGFMKEDSPGFYRQIKIWLLRHEGVL
jgi:methylated-DNA-[protein]-cysteine S-methyltransferase